MVEGLVIGLVVGVWIGGGSIFWASKGLIKSYKKKWREAIKLINELDDGKSQSKKVLPKKQIAPSPIVTNMTSYDRAEIQVERAKKGLPPTDDLRGMTSWDKRDVLMARVRAEAKGTNL